MVNLPKIRKKKKTRVVPRKIIKRLRAGIKKRMEEGEKKENIITGTQNFYIFGGGESNVFMPSGRLEAKGIEARGKGGERKEKEEDVEKKEGIDLNVLGKSSLLSSPLSSLERSSLEKVKLSYPLIPPNPKKGERVFAYAYITFDPRLNEVVYLVVEPEIGRREMQIIEKIKAGLEERLDIDFTKVGEIKAKEILKEHIEDMLKKIGVYGEGREKIIYYIERDIVGLDKIEPLMKDPEVEDISCDGVGVPVFVYHRNPMLGSLRTNVVFESDDKLDTFIMKLAQKCGKSVSIAEPLLDGTLPDGSRVQATLGTDIAMRGSNFTIRKFTSKPLTPVHMIKYNTLNSTQLAYLWLAVENGKSILISGGTATGKTSMLNALSLFIRPSLKVVSIEDTAELRLPHPHWVSEVARTPLAIEGKVGEVSLFDLLKASLRQRPDYIIVGEVRGKEAFVLFQQMATGHTGMATIHAASLPQLIDRLTTPPISLPATLIENLDIILFIKKVKVGDKTVRRTAEIVEVEGVKDEKLLTRTVFEWNPFSDTYVHREKSIVLKDIADSLGVDENSIKGELLVRKRILEWMAEHNVLDYRDVSKVIVGYYTNPERIINMVESS